MFEDANTEITDLALRLKEHFEDKSVEGLRDLASANVKINILGHFLTANDAFRRLREGLATIEQPTLDFLGITDSRVEENTAFVTYEVEVSYVDQQIWEEHVFTGLVSLEVARRRARGEDGGEGGWSIAGFTFARPVAQSEGDPAVSEPPRQTPVLTPGTFGSPTDRALNLDSLFSFWY